jgi:hypothetical protein
MAGLLATEEELENTRDERDALRAEVEALRADAERYRWLRSNDSVSDWLGIAHYFGDRLDAAIDAARAANGQG